MTYFYFPETRNMTIEEISTIFDNKDGALVSTFRSSAAKGQDTFDQVDYKAEHVENKTN